MRRLVVSFAVVVGLIAPGCARNHASKAAFCRQLRKTPDLSQVLVGYTNDAKPALQQKKRDAAAQFSKLERSAPRDIRSDVGTLSDLVDRVLETVNESPNDPSLIRYRLERLASTNAGAGKAALRMAGYAMKECKIDINNDLFQRGTTGDPGSTGDLGPPPMPGPPTSSTSSTPSSAPFGSPP